jgi:hypothetical protein
MFKQNWKALLLLGLAAGVIQALTGVVMYLAGIYFASWTMILNFVVLVLCIALGTRWYREQHLGSKISYGQAVVAGIVISVATGIIYAIYNVVSISFFYPHFLEDMVRAGTARIQASGASPAEQIEMIDTLKSTATIPIIAVGNLIRLSIIGSVLSLIISIFLKKRGDS